jgi:hypothetical protein
MTDPHEVNEPADQDAEPTMAAPPEDRPDGADPALDRAGSAERPDVAGADGEA